VYSVVKHSTPLSYSSWDPIPDKTPDFVSSCFADSLVGGEDSDEDDSIAYQNLLVRALVLHCSLSVEDFLCMFCLEVGSGSKPSVIHRLL